MDENETRKFANGWRLIDWDVFKRPPVWFAASCHILALAVICLLLFLTISALWRLAVGTGDYDHQAGADHARNLLIAVGAIVAAPFVVWRTWIVHQQWKTSTEQVQIQNDTLQTSLLTKAIEMLGSTREQISGASIDPKEPAGPDNRKEIKKIVPNTEARLGAMLILKRIANESPKDKLSIIEIFTSYLKEHTSYEYLSNINYIYNEGPEQGLFDPYETRRSESDIDLAIKTLISLNSDASDTRISLDEVSISHIDLSNRSICNIDFSHSLLICVNFSNSTFKNCNIKIRNVFDCEFWGSDLSSANLIIYGHDRLQYIDENTKLPNNENYEIIKDMNNQMTLQLK